MPEPSLYDRVGGMSFFERLVDRFYDGIRDDPVVGPMYDAGPDDPALAGPRRRLTLFLVQYWGGPTTYLAERGHPRLRARHFPFPIDASARDRWLLHMREAIDASDASPDVREELHSYMTVAAEAMLNVDEPAGGDGI
jgi:hemoglobin